MKFVLFQRLLRLTMRRIKRVDKWTSILESNPNVNGTYYVYVEMNMTELLHGKNYLKKNQE